MTAPRQPVRLVILGAGGRAGLALTTTALARGIKVTALVRDPVRHPGLATSGATVTAGDALDVDAVIAATAEAEAVVSAVTPFTAPPPSFDDFDTSFYRNVNAGILTAARANGIARVVTIGLFATLHLPDNRTVADDEERFPPELRPFAAAHHEGITYLQEHGDHTDWLVLTPPANLSTDAPITGRYQLGTNILEPQHANQPLSYIDLATAALDEIEHPTRHRDHVAVYGRSTR